MQIIDWVIVLFYFIVSLVIGLIYKNQAGKSREDYFLSGRKLPWWLAGLSMVATTFAADTPLAVTELVGKNGIAGNWLWWNMLIGGMLTVFFFSKLWRRAGILTDVEFIELRYSGKSAAFLRGFKSIYLGLFMNVIIMGWVNLAMIKILIGMFPEYVNESNVLIYISGCLFITAIYSAISGLWGVTITDAFQFIIAMLGCVILAVIVINQPQIGGIDGLKEKLPDWSLRFLPVISSETSSTGTGGVLIMTISSLLAFVGIQWWASWYPGAEPGGGGYVAQRMMSAKNEKHSLKATLFFQIAHYGVRPWPWIIVGLASLVLYPELSMEEKGIGYVKAMNDFLPVGFKGLMLAAFFAAYMSTIATHLNWGTSYFINDFYKRFIYPESKYINKETAEKSYVNAGRLLTVILMLLSIFVTTQMSSISGVWSFVIECGAGLGLVLILRWFWWRVNAISEITATITPFITYGAMKLFDIKVEFPDSLFIIVPITTISWLIATFLSKPVNSITLEKFYRRVHPGGYGWRAISKLYPEIKSDSGYIRSVINWICGIILVYMFLFGFGKIIFKDYLLGILFIVIGLISGYIIFIDIYSKDKKI